MNCLPLDSNACFCYTVSMGQEYRHKTTSVSLVNYHFVWAPRYRRKILTGVVDRRFREILGEVAEELELAILVLEVMPDHVHLFMNAPPDLSPADIVARIKGRTSHHMRREFPRIARMPSMWTRSYFVSTAGNVSSETIEKYIAAQKKRG